MQKNGKDVLSRHYRKITISCGLAVRKTSTNLNPRNESAVFFPHFVSFAIPQDSWDKESPGNFIDNPKLRI